MRVHKNCLVYIASIYRLKESWRKHAKIEGLALEQQQHLVLIKSESKGIPQSKWIRDHVDANLGTTNVNTKK